MPVRELLCKYINFARYKEPRELGICPEKQFEFNARYRSFPKFPTELGTGPVIRFVWKFAVLKFVNSPNSDGRPPNMQLS